MNTKNPQLAFEAIGVNNWWTHANMVTAEQAEPWAEAHEMPVALSETCSQQQTTMAQNYYDQRAPRQSARRVARGSSRALHHCSIRGSRPWQGQGCGWLGPIQGSSSSASHSLLQSASTWGSSRPFHRQGRWIASCPRRMLMLELVLWSYPAQWASAKLEQQWSITRILKLLLLTSNMPNSFFSAVISKKLMFLFAVCFKTTTPDFFSF